MVDVYVNLTTALDLFHSAVVRFRNSRGLDMDLLMILATMVFFGVAIAYTVACDKLK